MQTRRLTAVLAHPDDESLGFGGVLAKYASEGVETSLFTATRGESGRFRGHRWGDAEHPGPSALASIREQELRAAATALGIRHLDLLEYRDGQLDRVNVAEAVAHIVSHLRRVRPQVVVTFGPDGAYGHPDHVAISQFATAAAVAAADPAYRADGADGLEPHVVSKLYYLANTRDAWAAYEAAFRKLVVTVDGIERHATPWPEWAVSAVIDTAQWWPTVWRAVTCHESQIASYAALKDLSPEHHRALWGSQSFYRAFSLANGGHDRESDLFEGLRG